MNKIAILLVSLLSFLLGCNSANSFKKKKGIWYFKDQPITVKDPSSFTPLSDGYAKDNLQVYYCDTYRKGQEYFLVRHISVSVLNEADAASFRYLKFYYAKDKIRVFFKGEHFPVKDVGTFEVLEYGFARDSVSGYFQRTEINGSDGKTFLALDNNYSKDKKQVYYSSLKRKEESDPGLFVTNTLKGTDPLSFKILYDEYAADEKNVYYQDKIISGDVQNFQVLQRGYAKSRDKVYYLGTIIPAVDVSSFKVLTEYADSADAKDTSTLYLQGKKSKNTKASGN